MFLLNEPPRRLVLCCAPYITNGISYSVNYYRVFRSPSIIIAVTRNAIRGRRNRRQTTRVVCVCPHLSISTLHDLAHYSLRNVLHHHLTAITAFSFHGENPDRDACAAFLREPRQFPPMKYTRRGAGRKLLYKLQQSCLGKTGKNEERCV